MRAPTPTPIQDAVEVKHGKPFWDVVKQFASDGESINNTARLLGYAHPNPLHKLVRKKGVTRWFRAPTHTNSYLNAKVPGNRNRKKASRGIQALVRSFALEGRYDSLAGHCRRRGLNRKTVGARLFRGWTLQDAMEKPVRKHNKKLNGEDNA